MINDLEDLKHALAVLETHGGDTNAIEAKTFSEYSPQQLGPTLSAFANMPDGGVILLGVSERNGIDVVGIDNGLFIIEGVGVVCGVRRVVAG